MSLSDDSHSTRAVLKSVLAFSSLHRNGVQSQAAELKISALGALGAAAQTSGFGTREATQHVAAGMLLYSFEVLHALRLVLGYHNILILVLRYTKHRALQASGHGTLSVSSKSSIQLVLAWLGMTTPQPC